MAHKLRIGDRVASIHNPDTRYRVEANNNGWLTVRVADDPLNADLVYARARASIFVKLPPLVGVAAVADDCIPY